jgi:hypothetical protein
VPPVKVCVLVKLVAIESVPVLLNLGKHLNKVAALPLLKEYCHIVD